RRPHAGAARGRRSGARARRRARVSAAAGNRTRAGVAHRRRLFLHAILPPPRVTRGGVTIMSGVLNDVRQQEHLDWTTVRSEAFDEMQTICASKWPLPEQLRACARVLVQDLATAAPPHLAEQARACASAFARAADGDYSGVAAQFTETVA